MKKNIEQKKKPNSWIQFSSGFTDIGKKYRNKLIKDYGYLKRGKKIDVVKRNAWIVSKMSELWPNVKQQQQRTKKKRK
jgi:hypothetical protein